MSIPIRFDEQAESFDHRAGLPAEVCRQAARAIMDLARLKGGDVLLEVGAGTGFIGSEIMRLPPTYIGLDISHPMLRVFRRRIASTAHIPSLIVADATAWWPIADGSVGAVFGSRALHLIPLERVVAEVVRVGKRTGVTLLIGRVHRDPSTVASKMRHQMRRLLGEKAPPGRSGEESANLLIRAFQAQGASYLPPYVAAQWTTTHSPAQSIASWRSKSGLAGISVPQGVKDDVLLRLQDWATKEFGNLDAKVESREGYVLEGVQLP